MSSVLRFVRTLRVPRSDDWSSASMDIAAQCLNVQTARVGVPLAFR